MVNFYAFFNIRICSIYCLIVLSFFPFGLFSQGLKFRATQRAIEQRTSYEVFAHKEVSFQSQFNISFQLSIYAKKSLGNILRVKDKNSEVIYSVFYDEEGEDCLFRLNEEGKSSLIVARVKGNKVFRQEWISVKLTFDLRNKCFLLEVNGETFRSRGNIALPENYSPQITFGKSDYIIDVPFMSIKDVRVGDSKQSYFFPLSESQGNAVHDEYGTLCGYVSNPEWLINDAYRWKSISVLGFSVRAGSNYNERTHEVYYFSQDSITIYNIQTKEVQNLAFKYKCPVQLIQANNFIDTINNRLYVYETYFDKPYTGPTVASLDLKTYEWKVESMEQLGKELHHHGFFFDPHQRKYYIFGGYGQMFYSNQIYAYSLDSTTWQHSLPFSGDRIFPRYFSAVGLSKDNSVAYIFGGMGNESGNHLVGRTYFYDLYQMDIKNRRLAKMWNIHWKDKHVVPARGLVLPDTSHFYVLCYPEHLTESAIQLYRFSINKGDFQILGDSIPIYSDKISTHAQLYYDKKLARLLALVQESSNDVQSTLKIYTLNFPPISESELVQYTTNKPKRTYFVWLFLFMGTACVGYMVYYFKIRRKNKNPLNVNGGTLTLNADENKQQVDTREEEYFGKNNENKISLQLQNAIYLFGEFKVWSKEGKDITYLFSARLKQAFCLILGYDKGKGISSSQLSQYMWPDRTEDKVKNSRGVTINHLRKALSELEGIELVYEKGKFRFVLSEPFYCDYARCLSMTYPIVEKDFNELLHIVCQGRFLNGMHHPIYDSLKAEMEKNIIPMLLMQLRKKEEDARYQEVLKVSDAIFVVDTLNEEALIASIKAQIALNHSFEAQIKYQQFIVEYKYVMGEDYMRRFEDLV